MRSFDELWDYGKPKESRERFLSMKEVVGVELLPELLTQIGRTYSLERNFSAAHNILNEADSLIDETMLIAKIRSLLERGRTFNSAGEKAKACSEFELAFQLATREGADGYAVDAAHMLGIVAAPEVQLDWNLRALEMAVNSADPTAQKWQGSLLNNIGWTYFEQADYATALDFFMRCRAYFEQIDNPNRAQIARWSIAKTRRMMGKLEAALQVQMAMLAAQEESGSADGYTLEEIGECLYALGRSADAAPYFASAHAQLSQDIWLTANEPDRLARLLKLAQQA